MRKLLFIGLVLLSLQVVAQQDIPNTFTLQEAIDYALQNNRNAILANKDITAAEKQKWETTATGLPQINAEVNYQNFLKQQVSVVPAEFFGGQPGELAEVIFGAKQTATGTATLSQKIFDGTYLVGLQSAKVFLEISKNAKIKTDLQVREGVINAFGNVLLAQESISILESNIEVLEKNLFDITKIYENGFEEEESVEQLKITLSGVKNQLNKTKRLETIAYQMLNLTLGIPYNYSITLTDNLETLTQRNILFDTNGSNEVTSTIDYLIAQNDKTAKELLVKLEKSKALPTLSAFLNGGYSSFGDEFVFLDKDNKWFASSLLGVNLKIPIFSSLGRSAATQRAEINLDKAELQLIETEQKLQLQINSAKNDYEFAVEDYENKKENLALAQRIESKNQTKFFEGVATSFDLRQAQIQLYTTQQEYLQTMLNVLNAKAKLETLTNQTSTY
ncbi:TolC family protein [Aurantibacter aestuarii]|uniref:Transporter n=1 Tax=Aurantibacter aestuarii TaxID=1266046 RepID=A0A2T1NDP9_9FLAO|nr:TolC family protein [Aurantibacter aestuarii]PSG90568.1 transporter [Aurantibacter aestuarii]